MWPDSGQGHLQSSRPHIIRSKIPAKTTTKEKAIADEKRLIRFRFGAVQDSEGEAGHVLSNTDTSQATEMHDRDDAVMGLRFRGLQQLQ